MLFFDFELDFSKLHFLDLGDHDFVVGVVYDNRGKVVIVRVAAMIVVVVMVMVVMLVVVVVVVVSIFVVVVTVLI